MLANIVEKIAFNTYHTFKKGPDHTKLLLSTYYTVQKVKFSIKKISSVNVTKSAGNCGFGHIYWRNP